VEEKEEKQKLIQKYKEAMRYEHCSFFSSCEAGEVTHTCRRRVSM